MEVESDFGPSQTPAASNNATQVIVQVSFPPNLVPREKRPGDEVAFHQDTSPLRAIVHINRKLELQPVAEVTADSHKAWNHLKLLTRCVSTTCCPPIQLEDLEHLEGNRDVFC